MSRSLDIAKILRATEIDNPTNARLITTPDDLGGGMDSAEVQGVGMLYVDTLDSLPLNNLQIGQQAFVNANRRHYVSNGSGWYNTQYVISSSPYWEIEPGDSDKTIIDSATPLIIIAKANDSDNPNLVNQSFGSDSAQYMATVTNDSSVFTFTPKTKAQLAAAISAGNLTDSNGDFVYTFKWSDGTNFVAKAVTIAYNTAGAAGWWNRLLYTVSPSVGRGISEAPNGDIYVFGGSNNSFLAKYNSAGEAQWGKTLNANAYYARPKTVTSDSTSAYTVTADYGYGENMSGYPDPQLALAIKWTSAGAITWAKIIKPTTTTTNYDNFVPEPGGGQLDSSGNLWVLGTSRRGGSGAVGSQQLRDTSIRKFYIAKLNGSTGALMGMWKLNSNTDEQASDQSIVIDGDDNIYVCGAQYRDHSGYGFPSMLIAKFNSSMTFQWAKMYGVNDWYKDDNAYIVRVDANNNPYIVGHTDDNINPEAATLLKLNKNNGSIVWGKKHEGEGHQGLAIDNNDNVWVLSIDADESPSRIKLRKYSSNGTIQNQWGIDTNVSNYKFSMSRNALQIASDGSLLMNFYHYYSGVSTEQSPIKMPTSILDTAGTYGDLIISNQTAEEATHTPSALTFVSYSGTDVGSLFQTVNYNSGSYAIEPTVALTVSSENISTL